MYLVKCCKYTKKKQYRVLPLHKMPTMAGRIEKGSDAITAADPQIREYKKSSIYCLIINFIPSSTASMFNGIMPWWRSGSDL